MRPMRAASYSSLGSDRDAPTTLDSDPSRFRSASGKGERSLGQVFRVALPTRQHGREIIPPVQDHHDQVSKDKKDQCAENTKMPNPSPVKPPHRPAKNEN